EDLLKLDHADLAQRMGGRLCVIGNLPYSITTDALLSLVASPGALRYAVVMIQKEAAERVVAPPGSKDYSPLSVMLQTFARPRMLYSVPPTAFYPKPKVTSAIVELDFPAPSDLPQ
ncbi:rsmA, partial [Symbiodinium pilosum]